MKWLLQRGSGTGREISSHIKLPFSILDPLLKQWKQSQLLAYKSAAEMGDYLFQITEQGRDRARRYMDECSYAGAAPVVLADYLKAMESQTIAESGGDRRRPEARVLRPADLRRYVRATRPGDQLGPRDVPVRRARERQDQHRRADHRCFGSTIWIPRTLGIDGEIIRLFDPGVHEEIPRTKPVTGCSTCPAVDQRWVRIVRPTIVAGGELTMDDLEVTQNPFTENLRSPAATQEQLRHARDRRLRPPDDASGQCCSTAGSCRSKSDTTF